MSGSSGRRHGPGLAALCLGWALLGLGCVGAPPDLPEDRFYRLPAPAPHSAAARYAGTIAVALPESDGLHSERALLYSQHDRPLEILRHHYFYWTESPPRLLQDFLVQYLRRAGVADQVVGAGVASGKALRLESRLLRFERHIGGARPQVLVELELGWRSRAGARPRAVYRVLAPAADDSIYATVQAYGLALDQILAAFVQEHPPG